MSLSASSPGVDLHSWSQNLDIPTGRSHAAQTDLEATAESIDALLAFLAGLKLRLGVRLPDDFESLPGLDDLLTRLAKLPGDREKTASTILESPDLERLCRDLDVAADWRAKRNENAETFIDQAFDTPVVELRGPLAAGANSFFARWGGPYRSASRQLAGLLKDRLPRAANERID